MADIAEKIIEITEEMWLSCNEFNRNMINEYLESAVHLSPKSQKQYKSKNIINLIHNTKIPTTFS